MVKSIFRKFASGIDRKNKKLEKAGDYELSVFGYLFNKHHWRPKDYFSLNAKEKALITYLVRYYSKSEYEEYQKQQQIIANLGRR